ncbi:MAG: histidine phosphatase family protein [Ottowia sp.]
MQQATRIIAIRHGETDWNRALRMQGHLDIALNLRGLWQAQATARALAGEDVAAVYSSDLQRASATARAIAAACCAPLHLEEGLRERHLGSFQGWTFDEVQAHHPDQALRWRQRDITFAPAGGETLVQISRRILTTAARLAARHPGEQIVLVGHGGMLDMLYRSAMRLDLQTPRSWPLENAAINRLLHTASGLTLTAWADTFHFDQIEDIPR